MEKTISKTGPGMLQSRRTYLDTYDKMWRTKLMGEPMDVQIAAEQAWNQAQLDDIAEHERIKAILDMMLKDSQLAREVMILVLYGSLVLSQYDPFEGESNV